MKTKNVILIISALLIGYVLGVLISFPEVDSSFLSGDIGKAAKYNKSSNIEVKAFQERIESDSLFRRNTVASLVLANSQISQFKRLVEVTDSIIGNTSALEECSRPILAMKEFAYRAKANTDTSLVAFTALLKGEGTKSGYDYEALSKTMMISNIVIDKQYDAARSFVSGVDFYLKQGKVKVEGLQELRDSWVLFCAHEAALNGRKHEMEYWKQQDVISDNENLLNCLIGLSGFPDNENLLEIFPGLSAFPDNENLLDIFPGIPGLPDNETLQNN